MPNLKAIPDYPNYFVGDDGNVYSTKSGTTKKLSSKSRCVRGKYRQVALWKNNKARVFLICRLVLTLFVGPRPEGLECCHGPAGKDDDSLTNLRWDTRKSNIADMLKDGVFSNGSKHYLAKIDEKGAARILAAKDTGERSEDVAKREGISRQAVAHIWARRTWKHVSNP